MKRWIKWTAAGVALVGALAGAAIVTGVSLANRKMDRRLDVPVKAVASAEGPVAIERGKYLFDSRGCAHCHGSQAEGRLFVNEGSMRVAGPNITSGGPAGSYTPEDWVRLIRHGVKPSGRPVMIMPSDDYARYTDEDVAALIAYLRSLPPVKGGAAVVELPLPVRVLYGFGAIHDSAEQIDHTLPPAAPVPVAVNAQHGAYVANMCTGCHGAHLSGGKIPNGPPDWPAAANLTPGEGSAMGRYGSAIAFTAMLKSGKRPDGTAIQVMPFDTLAALNEVDASALYEFLKSLPARPAGQR
jgi:mono/diheme cytochrome c family protein